MNAETLGHDHESAAGRIGSAVMNKCISEACRKESLHGQTFEGEQVVRIRGHARTLLGRASVLAEPCESDRDGLSRSGGSYPGWACCMGAASCLRSRVLCRHASPELQPQTFIYTSANESLEPKRYSIQLYRLVVPRVDGKLGLSWLERLQQCLMPRKMPNLSCFEAVQCS